MCEQFLQKKYIQASVSPTFCLNEVTKASQKNLWYSNGINEDLHIAWLVFSHTAIPLAIASQCNKLGFTAAMRARYFVAIIKNIRMGFVLHVLAKHAVQERSLPGQPPVSTVFPKVSQNIWSASLPYLYWRTTCA